MKLRKGKKYRLWTEEIIRVDDIYPAPLKDGTIVDHARCTMISRDKATSKGYTLPGYTLWKIFRGKPWPGSKNGDEMIYLADEGLYCAWDHRNFPLHVKEEVKE